MGFLRRLAGVSLILVCALFASSCSSRTCPVYGFTTPGAAAYGVLSFTPAAADPLALYNLTGNTGPVLDPSIIRQNSTYYAFSTDVGGQPAGNYLKIRCSEDKVNWTLCSSVFPNAIPAWITQKIPGIGTLWAPDISYFNGLYHVYYAGSMLGTQQSVIGLATNKTLDPKDPAYQWTDQGEVLESNPGDDFNAIDPTILVDTDGAVWLTYGSYWSGIKQRQIDPATGILLASNCTCYNLATRPGVTDNPIEGASLVHHGSYYYLFVSVDFCCSVYSAPNAYKQAVGRSTSPHGPFTDENGVLMMDGGATVLMRGDSAWGAPGGGTAYIDSEKDESLIIFHAHDLKQKGAPYQWVKNLKWVNDWPVIEQ